MSTAGSGAISLGPRVHLTSYDSIEPFVTKDGSEIREWAGRAGFPSSPAVNQSLAEATIPPGGATTEHYHRLTEELYLVTAGRGVLRIDGEEREVGVGDCAVIPPGSRHKLRNTGDEPLRIVCACAPPYAHEDTVLTE
jgi:mannose-6-phosphate isomerase-like protein (cupin superfamily)